VASTTLPLPPLVVVVVVVVAESCRREMERRPEEGLV
jgi:hypothetical protein